MEQAELTLQYRELDRDCALLSYRINSPNRYFPQLFIPDEAAAAQAREDRQALCRRLEALEAPDAVYALVRRHLADFLDSLEYAINDAEKNPLQAYLGFPYTLEHTARCDRRADETRCASLEELAALLEKSSDQLLALVQAGPEAERAAASLRRTARTAERDGTRLAELFPSFSVTQRGRTARVLERVRALLEGMADSLPGEEAAPKEPPEDDLSITVQMAPEDYRALLGQQMGVSLAFVPEDRLGMGLVGSMGMTGNMMLRSWRKGKGAFVNRKDPNELALKVWKDLEVVVPSTEFPIRRLSGGNVQKVLVGREIATAPSVLMCAYAVRGLDINTSYTIYNLLTEQKMKGAAVIYVGEDLDVLLELCDRILVLCGGQVSGVVDARTATKDQIGLLMTRLGGKEGA